MVRSAYLPPSYNTSGSLAQLEKIAPQTQVQLPAASKPNMIGLTPEDSDTPRDFTSQISATLKGEIPCDSGTFGMVYRRTIESSEGTIEVAVKIFKIGPQAGRAMEKINKGISRELKVWLRLQHPTIVPLLGIANVPDSQFPALISEWMSSGTLYMYLEKQGTISASTQVKLARGVADGLEYLHSKNVVHGDLHPGNVLVDCSGHPRLTDFGLATVAGDVESQLNTTTAGRSFNPQWRAPEVIGVGLDDQAVRPNFKSDVYSFGGVMFFIVSGVTPWKEKKNSTHIIIELSKGATPARPDNILDDHWKLINKCWSRDPMYRPDATEITRYITMNIATMNSGETEMADSTIQSSPKRHKIIVLFGATGTGKSSLINLMAGKEVATTSPDMQRCTMQWQDYIIDFDGDSYMVFDTIGLEEPQLGIREYLESVENAYRLIKELDRIGGIDLFLFCIRADRVTATTQSNYRLFHEFICEKKIPIVLVITHLEREQRMEDWWERNQATLQSYRIQVAGHACITAANRLDGRHQTLYEESRITICNLVKQFTADGQKQIWIGGDNLFVSLMRKLKEFLTASSLVRKKDLVLHLTKRCGMSRDIARQLAQMIKQA